MHGKFFLFINFLQAARLGHVGWGFLVDEGRYMFGATDHLYRHDEMDLAAWIAYMNVPPGAHTDWWCDWGSEEDMMAAMGGVPNPNPNPNKYHIWYHSCKSVEVVRANPEEAEAKALALATAGWSVLTNNCVQQTYEVIEAYGAHVRIPSPRHNPLLLVPRLWFGSFGGEVKQLNKL